jgi:hypothetical protein
LSRPRHWWRRWPAFCRRKREAHIVTFGALGFLDRALAQFDAERHRAQGERIGFIRARLARRGNTTLREIGQSGLIEKIGHRCVDLGPGPRTGKAELS